jgi:hypothetical protein
VLTVIVMQRDSSNTVTRGVLLPVLIPASSREKEGVATFAMVDESPQSVRMFRTEDLKCASKNLPDEEAGRFIAVIRLRKALENPADSAAIEEAVRALQPLAPQPYGPESPFGGFYPVVQVISQDPYKEKVFWPKSMVEQISRSYGVDSNSYSKADPRVLLSYVLSNELRDARLVLWWADRRFRPALWCPNVKTAFYARVLLGVVGGKGFAVCPHCGNGFVQDRPDQEYCSISHREAHRVARWRAQQKQKAIEKGNKRRKNGTEKTR